jgi:DNA-binding XRE family transcriptional regulator
MTKTPENMRVAALAIARGSTGEEAASMAGVSRQTVYNWMKAPEWEPFMQNARMQVAEEKRGSNIITLHPDRVDTAAPRPVAAPESGELVDHAIEVLRSALTEGDVRAATWVLERVDPERFGTPKDRQVMAELRKAAATSKGGPVRVTIAAPKRREQSA